MVADPVPATKTERKGRGKPLVAPAGPAGSSASWPGPLRRPADSDLAVVARAVQVAMKWSGDPMRDLMEDPQAALPKYSMIDLSVHALRPRDGQTHDTPLKALIRTQTAMRLWLALCYRATRSNSSGVVSEFLPIGLAPMVGLRARTSADAGYEQAAQRIRSDLRKLAKLGLLTIDKSGVKWSVTMLRTDGSGDPWVDEASEGELFIRVPAGLVRHGWLSVLPTRALVTLLVLLNEWASKGRRWPTDTSERTYDRYGISSDVFLDGGRVLREWGLASYDGQTMKAMSGGPGDFRQRSVWTVDDDLFQTHTPLVQLPPLLWLPAAKGGASVRGRTLRDEHADDFTKKHRPSAAKLVARFDQLLDKQLAQPVPIE